MLQRIYKLLCKLYELEAEFKIEDFLIKQAPEILISGTKKISHRTPSREAVFVHQLNGAVEIGLFVHPDILQRLKTKHYSNDDLACAIEGVSHFIYLVECIKSARQCSQLELELQGEIDKFVLLHLFAANQQTLSPKLFKELFESFAFDDRLTEDELERYETAHHFAVKYCQRLRDSCFFPLRVSKLIANIRPFFRQNLQGKLNQVIP
jgi:hypothetical protein